MQTYGILVSDYNNFNNRHSFLKRKINIKEVMENEKVCRHERLPNPSAKSVRVLFAIKYLSLSTYVFGSQCTVKH